MYIKLKDYLSEDRLRSYLDFQIMILKELLSYMS